MITLETLQRWLNTPAETEHLEFKEAKNQYDSNNLMQYCAALANEGGGHLVLGVTDRMSNQSLRERFGLPELPNSTATVSQVIAAATEAGRIKVDDSESTSKRYARYLPYWA